MWENGEPCERFLSFAFLFVLLYEGRRNIGLRKRSCILTILGRWNRFKNEPSLEKTFTGFCFDGTGLGLAVAVVVDGVANGGAGEAYRELAEGVTDIVSETVQVCSIEEVHQTRRVLIRYNCHVRLDYHMSPNLGLIVNRRTMMFYNAHHHRHHGESSSEAPPEWTPAPEKSYQHGLRNEASEAHFRAAKQFCSERPLEQPRLLDSRVVDDIQTRGSAVWGLVPPGLFVGTVNNQVEMHGGGVVTKVKTRGDQDDCCLLSNLPIVAGQYHIPLTGGVYYEITVGEMEGYDSIIAIGAIHHPEAIFTLY